MRENTIYLDRFTMTSLVVAVAENSFNYSGLILCHYINTTSHLQILRSADMPNWYLERVVFPGERLLFAAPPVAQLEIHTNTTPTAIVSDTICCESLHKRCSEAVSRQSLGGIVA